MMLKRLLLNGIFLVAITCVSIVMLEGASSGLLYFREARIDATSTKITRPHTTHDTLLGWINRPGFADRNAFGQGISLSIDAKGFRGAEPVDSPSSVRLVCSGDSYTAGDGVSDGHDWCSLLEKRLPGLSTFNMSEGMYGLDQTYLWYKRDGQSIPHQVHVLGLTSSEIDRIVVQEVNGRRKPRLALHDGRLVAEGVPVAPQSVRDIQRAFAGRLKRDLALVQLADRFAPSLDPWSNTRERVDAHWDVVQAILGEIAAIDREHGSRLVLAYLPTRQDLGRGLDDRRQRLEALARDGGIPFVDLTPSLRAMRKDSSDIAFLPGVDAATPADLNGQYSNLGHAWVARSLSLRLDSLPEIAALSGKPAPPRR